MQPTHAAECYTAKFYTAEFYTVEVYTIVVYKAEFYKVEVYKSEFYTVEFNTVEFYTVEFHTVEFQSPFFTQSILLPAATRMGRGATVVRAAPARIAIWTRLPARAPPIQVPLPSPSQCRPVFSRSTVRTPGSRPGAR